MIKHWSSIILVRRLLKIGLEREDRVKINTLQVPENVHEQRRNRLRQ